MKKSLFILFFLGICLQGIAQYLMRGTLYDENGKGLFNIKIQLKSKYGYAFSAYNGTFVIPHTFMKDSIFLSEEGYEIIQAVVQADRQNNFVLKKISTPEKTEKRKLLSFASDTFHFQGSTYHGNESYLKLVENSFLETAKFPQSSFALNIDRASYSNIRRFITNEMKVPREAVKIEEMLNYFNFPTTTDTLSNNFQFKSQIVNTPWDKETNLLFLQFQAPSLSLENVPPCNLVLLIDVSGSMDQPNRLPLLQQSLKLLVQNLRMQDTVSIVVYGGASGVLLQPTSGSEKETIYTALRQLTPGGSTPGEDAIKLAYKQAMRMYKKDANNRVILATDGDFNVGQSSDKQLEDLIYTYQTSGIYLTCLGVGMGNYKDSKLEILAKKGNGNFAYLDNIQEAEKVLVTEFTKTLFAVATDASITVLFKDSAVKYHRLIGFDNKLFDKDTDTTALEGGDVGSGHILVAAYEIMPAFLDYNFEYDANTFIGSVELNYTIPHFAEGEQRSQHFNIQNNYRKLHQADSSLQFATAIIMFGELLKESEYIKDYSWDKLVLLLQDCVNANDPLQKEFLQIVEQAKKIYTEPKKKKR